MSSKGGKIVIGSVAVIASWFFGINFWKPLIIEQLEKDGNLRSDMKVPDYSDQPKSWDDIRQKFESVIDPSNLTREDKKSLEELKLNLEKNKPSSTDK
ncbi:unnamed protein product [Candida verbasci]|uniref:Uncharacterized protein n=1 Tax=Candida verbasci TaxID=1227364 RepID=A0A9W4TTA9_9ASCO|nr:unnamed protein product [Candida verbasci]